MGVTLSFIALLFSHLLFSSFPAVSSLFIVLSLSSLPCDLIARIIICSDRRPETKQVIEGKIVRLRSGRVRVRVRDRIRDKDRRSEAINFGAC